MLCLLGAVTLLHEAWAQKTEASPSSETPQVGLLTVQCADFFPPPDPSLAQTAYMNKLADQAEACDARADYFAHRGSLLLMAGRLAEAATNLEKALLLDPNLPGAQLDFAQALALLGQKDAALQLIDQVGGRSDIDPGLRQWLSHFQMQAKNDGWTWNALLQSSIGRETNLDSATHTDTLTLYLSNGPVVVSLNDTERPQSGTGIKNWLAVQGLRPLGQGEIRLSAALQSRNTPNISSVDHYQADGAITYAHPVGPGVASVKLAALSYRKSNDYAYQENGTVFKYEPAWRFNQCPWALAWGSADQQHQTTPIMSGTYQLIRLEASCKNSAGGVIAAYISTGTDRAQDPTRPGGNKKRMEYSLRYDQAQGLLGLNGQLSLWLRHHHSQDSDILSPLLGAKYVNARRLDLGLGYWWRINKHWSAGVDLERIRQKSNNELTQLKNTVFYSGVRWSIE